MKWHCGQREEPVHNKEYSCDMDTVVDFDSSGKATEWYYGHREEPAVSEEKSIGTNSTIDWDFSVVPSNANGLKNIFAQPNGTTSWQKIETLRNQNGIKKCHWDSVPEIVKFSFLSG